MANYLAGKDRQDLDHASIFRFCILFQIIASKEKGRAVCWKSERKDTNIFVCLNSLLSSFKNSGLCPQWFVGSAHQKACSNSLSPRL